MNPIEKIRHHSEALVNELTNLSVYISNLEVMSKEVVAKQVSLSVREKRVAEREAKVLADTHTNEDAKRQYEIDKTAFDAKQGKLQNEWARMSEEREKLEKDQEEIAKEKLRLQNTLADIKERETAIKEKEAVHESTEEMLKKKHEALDKMNKEVTRRKELTEERARKVDEMYSAVE